MTILSVAYKKTATLNFMTALVHEVKNPLTNINLSLVLLKSPLVEVDQKAYYDIIMRSTIRIKNIANKLLRYQDLEDINLKNQSAHQLLDTVLELAADRIELKKVRVVKNFSNEDYKLCVDAPKMIVALTNIVINAISAMAYGKGELTISTKNEDRNLIINIRDNGCGINKANLKHIFKPNFSINANGLGLGLTTASHIFKINNIAINVTSTVGQGTCFALVFKNIIVLK